MKLLKFIFFTLLNILSITLVFAQTPIIKNIDLLPAIKNISINEIAQDSLGRIWLASSVGIIKFDGIKSTQISSNEGLPSDLTSTLFIKDNTIYAGFTNGKLAKYEINSNKVKDISIPEISDKINQIFVDNKTIYVGTNGGGLFVLQNDTLINYNSFNQLNDDYVYTIIKYKSKIWLGTDIGIAIYSPKDKSFSFISQTNGLPDNIVKKLKLKNDTLWIGTESGGIGFYSQNSKKYQSFLTSRNSILNDFLITKNSSWIATQSMGLINIIKSLQNNTNWNRLGSEKGLLSNKIQTIFIDRENNIWVGSNKGLSFINDNSFWFIDSNDKLPFSNIVALACDTIGRKWFCSSKGIFVAWKNNMGDWASKQLFSEEKYKNHVFTSLYLDDKGFMWASTFGFGVYKINIKNFDFININTSNGLSDNSVLHISGQKNEIWLSTLGGGEIRLNTNDSTDIRLFNDSTNFSNYIYSSYTDSKGNTWIAQDGKGLAQIGKKTIFINEKYNLKEKTIYSITEDAEGGIWFSTPKSGVYRIFNDSLLHFTKNNGLSDNKITVLYSNPKLNYVILASNMGIDIYNLNTKSIVSYGNEYKVSFKQPNLNAYGNIDGNTWIGTNKGAIVINPALFEINQNPTVFIEKIRLHGENFSEKNPELSYKMNHFEFNFNGIWLQAPQNLLFRYRLKNFDLDWIDAGMARSVVYSNLPPGNFVFEVQVSKDGHKWISDKIAKYPFTIDPPFWQNPYFIVITLILLILAILFSIRMRTKALVQAKNNLEKEVLKRTEEIEKQKEELKTQKDHIEDINKNLTDSIIYARRIQHAVLTPFNQIENILKNYFILFKPRDIVSGDFYWISKYKNWRIIVAGDCTGHGVPGALMSMLGISFLNDIIAHTDFENFRASEILNQLRTKVKQSLRQTGKVGENQDGMDMALIAVNTNKKNFQYAGANLPLVLVRNNELRIWKPDRMPIGIYRNEKLSFTNHICDLHENDIFYLFSDGYQDQFGGPRNRKFLFKSLRQLLLSNSHLPLKEQKLKLEKTLEEWMGNKLQLDDILVLAWKYKKNE